MDGDQCLEPEEDALLLAEVLLLELDHNLLEQRADQFMVFQTEQCVGHSAIITVGEHPVKGLSVIGGQCLPEHGT